VFVNNPETTVREAARISAENDISGAPVVDDEGRLLGMITEGHLLHNRDWDATPAALRVARIIFVQPGS